MRAPNFPNRDSAREVNVTPGSDGKPIKTKDIMLHDEGVLKERRFGAFKNYTYRGPDIGGVLQRLSEAINNDSEEDALL